MTADAPNEVSAVLARVDLNLLLTLDTLLRERSVTRSAAALGLGQPAISASLARLRRYFADDLLVRSGNSYELTPLAASLVPRTAQALAAVGTVFAAAADFDPSTSEREFTLGISDYAAAVLAAPLSAIVRAEAPHVRLRIQQAPPTLVDRVPESLRDIDALVLPHGFISGVSHRDLYQDEFVLVVAADNDAVNGPVTLEQLARMPMVVPFNGPTSFTVAAKQLQMAGLESRVEVITESFTVLPFLLPGTDRAAMVPALLARRFAGTATLRVVETAFTVTGLVEAVWWHPMYEADPGHRWLRDTLVESAAHLD